MNPLWCDSTLSTGKAILLAVSGIATIVSLISLKILSDKDNKGK